MGLLVVHRYLVIRVSNDQCCRRRIVSTPFADYSRNLISLDIGMAIVASYKRYS
jgi:hypothetical protein